MEDLTGRQFGPYQIIAPLGEGGMAAVYKAYQPSMDRYVALKVLPRHFADDPQFTSRFQREAKLLAQLQHPHILPVFDYGQAEGYSYIVMPFVQGGTLMDSLKDQPLPPQLIRQVITQVANALNYAHSHGLIHRDVKPSNVLIDESGNYLLSDFGLARMVETSMNLTASGAIVGTPTYMSPEQGSGLELDGRSDIYSLGVILYEMATGRVPYRAETPVAVIIKHINDPLPPPRTINLQLSEAMERVIFKALAKDPVDRFQTAAEMIQAVEAASSSEVQIVSGQAVETKNVMHKTVFPITPWWKIGETLRGKVALVSGLVVVLALGLLVSRLSSPLQIAEPDTTRQVVNETGMPLDNSLTSLPHIPSRTPVPTRTMGATYTPSSPGEAFAAPILAAIADRPPSFEDDFSTDKGWREGRGWTTPSIQDGQLYLQVGANIDWMSMINPTIRYRNFVMLVDSTVREFAGKNTKINLSWGAWGNSMNFGMSAVQTWESSWCGPITTCPEFYESGPVRLEKDVPVSLMVIVRGNEWAAYVDGALLAYVNDSAHSIPDDFIALRGWADAETRSAIITYDNFQIWNLANVPGLP